MKTLILLWGLMVGIGGVSAQGVIAEWVETDYSGLKTGDVVVLVDENQEEVIALPNNDSDFIGVNVTVKKGKISGTVSESIQWTLTKNDNGTVTFRKSSNLPLSGKSTSSGAKLFVGNGNTSEFTCSYGQLSCSINSKDYNIAWSFASGFYRAVLQEGNSGLDYQASFTFFKKQEKQKEQFVKWKQVQGPVTLATNDEVVVVDLTTSNAMKNNPAYEEGKTVSKDAPSAMKVTLKEELDRLTCEIGDTLIWRADRTGGYQFYMLNDEGSKRHLFNSDQALRVGFVDDDAPAKRIFDLNKALLHQKVKTDANKYTDYHVGFKQATGIQSFMGGSTWDLAAVTENGDVNADIAATKMAFFKKVVTDLVDPTLAFEKHDYEADVQKPGEFVSPKATVEAGAGAITYWSGNTDVATVNASTGAVKLKKRGTVRIYAQVDATDIYDDYLTSYVLRIDDTSKQGSREHPFTVKQAIEYAKATGHEEETANGVCYFVKGMVSSVGGMMAGMEGMEDMMDMFSGMMEGMGSGTGGFDMSAMFSMFMGEQEEGTVTYTISDNGVNRDSLSIINGRGLELVDITADSICVGDWVTVYGPLEYSEDQDMMSMFSGLGIGGNNNQNENQPDKRTVKMPRVNYLQEHEYNLMTEDVVLYYGETKRADELFSIKLIDRDGKGTLITPTNAEDKSLPMASLKLSDTDVAAWVLNEEQTDSLLTPKMEGIITVTVSAPVMLQLGDTIKMKRKFNLDVRDRRLLPAGSMDGHYELVTNVNQLKADDKLLIVATIDEKPKVLNRKVSASGGGTNPIMSMFGGGSNGSNITLADNGKKIYEVPDDARILTLEQVNNKWRLQTGRTADYVMTYLYISDTDGGGMFGGGGIPGMGGGGAKVKAGKLETIGDSCQVTFAFPSGKNDSVKIQFNFADREKDGKTVAAKNILRYSKSMMSSSFGGYDAASTEGTLPRLYRLVHETSFDITVDESGWSTIVPYTDVTIPDELEAYVVTNVATQDNERIAYIAPVESLKGGEPYLIHSEASGPFTLTVSTEAVAAPRPNFLQVSDNETADGVYILANDNIEPYFYAWNGGLLGSGRVYLSQKQGDGKERILLSTDPYGGVATGISEAVDNSLATGKAYDLQGRQVTVNKKGLYIVNGKKMVVK